MKKQQQTQASYEIRLMMKMFSIKRLKKYLRNSKCSFSHITERLNYYEAKRIKEIKMTKRERESP